VVTRDRLGPAALKRRRICANYQHDARISGSRVTAKGHTVRRFYEVPAALERRRSSAGYQDDARLIETSLDGGSRIPHSSLTRNLDE